MSDAASLLNLHDIVAPAPVGWWPPAPGWYVLAAALALLAVMLAARQWRRYRANRYRRLALRELAAMVDSGEPGRLRDLPILLKRTALAAWPRSEVAALGGRDWARFLDATSGGNGFSAGAGETLERLAYGGGTALPEPHELRRLTDAAENWIRRHRPPGGGA